MNCFSDDIALWEPYGIECLPRENSKQKTLIMDDNRKDDRVIEINEGRLYLYV